MHSLLTTTTPARRLASSATVLAAVLSLGVLGVVGASGAQADEPGDGWVRVAHLSPDTKSVDVKLTALSGGAVVSELDDVAYGAVSPYIDLPHGIYVISMVPSDAPTGTAPVIQQSVEVKPGQPLTVAAYGKNADLDTAVFPDDLTPPAAGQARVRVIQASTTAKSVDIETTTGTAITTDAQQGTATGYSSVAAGPWTLDVTADTTSSTAQIDLASGAVATLFVLDNASGGVTLTSVIDSASVGDLPSGGIQTGGGATATQHVNGSAATGVDGHSLDGASTSNTTRDTATDAATARPRSLEAVGTAAVLAVLGAAVLVLKRVLRRAPEVS
ncbi:DUF4397 domain-containing protein [Herbiconiux daphne]|uniref:DUF4397 domain-containing protein n=1 Tax=Herbiconiux daphne TaxID=2970914 RepID=A0ABT2GW09_9MICO|nr:DUF4397 domain-containing protein [Herbiconiux daphne]MCS5732138.1 DUF4397 domain-containing protein [Herbiconiux daphne]